MIDPTPNVRRLAEAELYRAELEARRVARQFLWMGCALLIVALAVIMLTVSGFLALSEVYGPTIGALATGGILLALAFAALLFAAKKPGRTAELELQLADEQIARARTDLRRDFDNIERSLDEMTMGLLSLLKGSAGKLPLISLILSALAALSPALRRFIHPIINE